MDQGMINRLESSFKLLAPRGPELVDRFYAEIQAAGGGRFDTSSLITRLG